MKKVLFLLLITVLVAQICAVPDDKDLDKKAAGAKDKVADEAKNGKDKADNVKDKAEDAAKDKAKTAAKEAEHDAHNIEKAAEEGDDEAEKPTHHRPRHHRRRHGFFQTAVGYGEGIVDGFAGEIDSLIDF